MRPFAKRVSFVSLAVASCIHPSFAQQLQTESGGSFAASGQLVATTVVQDEPMKLPEDMTALFSNQDRRIRFQVVKLSSDERQLFANKVISVVNPQGETQRTQTDSSGYASMNIANSGLHAVVVSEDSGHSAIPLAVREVSDDEAKANAKVVRVPLVDVDPNEVLAAVRSTVSSGAQGPSASIDTALVDSAPIGESFGYKVMLSGDGKLNGQVISLLNRSNAPSVQGAQISIFQNQALVATTFADQNGSFNVPNLIAGYYGLICTSPAGYAAFGFEARDVSEVAARQQSGAYTLVSTAMTAVQGGGMSSLPVILVPQPMMENVLQSVEEFYAPPLASGVTPITPFGGPAGLGGAGGLGGGGAGAAGAAGGLGGAGGLLGLAAAGGVAAAAIGASNNQNITPLPNTNAGP